MSKSLILLEATAADSQTNIKITESSLNSIEDDTRDAQD